jgi:hypothetical protein
MDHDLVIESDFVEPGWWATCSCGWIGETWEDHDDALLDGYAHRDGVEGEVL